MEFVPSLFLIGGKSSFFAMLVMNLLMCFAFRLFVQLQNLHLYTDKLLILLEKKMSSVWCLGIGLTVTQNQGQLVNVNLIWRYATSHIYLLLRLWHCSLSSIA